MPVLETLGGALFGAVLQVLFDKLDSHQVLDYFRGRKLDGRLLKTLKWKLMSVNAVLDDAEQKQFTDKNVKEWLDEVRDVLLNTEDLLEEIDYEFTKTEHVYNNPRIEEAKFDIKVWICVSDDFDVLMLSKTILNKITKSKDDSGDDLEMVHGRLKEKLSGNKYLFVLDDVWNEDRDQWKALQTPLKYGAKGSKILVTTRSNNVASIMQSNKVHELKQLREDHSWQVFAQHAFQDDYPKLNAELKEIGIKIIEKCQGLPLALETVGCLLHKKPSISQWEGVLKSKIWELPKEESKIIPALLLSYFHLPSHLKRCFAYCALFPKDHEFYKESLIQLWVAENFVQCSQQSNPQEEIGEQYFNDLLSRSFFQRSSIEKCFFMHDLLNDLAKYVCGDICFRLQVDKPKSISKVRHFSFVTEDDQYFDGYGSLYHAQRLRTFMPMTEPLLLMTWGGRKLVDELFSKFKFLRILSLSQCDLKEMPDSVGNLNHLRSLDLSYTSIKKLPDSMCFLCNLQVLKLNCCVLLEELPSNLHKLTNLRCLEFMYTKVRKMPMHMGKLKNLQVLSSFYVGKGIDNCSIQQLGELNLHGRLSIEELQNIVNPLDALAADLKNKTHLLDLELEWNWDRNLDDSIKERQVFENLQPSRHLEKLSIRNYGGTQFPSWLSDNSLCNVVSLTLMNCKYFLCLPPLGLLPILKELSIEGLDGIVSINADFFGSSSCSFTSLESLKFSDMKEWEEWECKGVTGAFPRLQRLSIMRCPKLKGHLPEQLCHLNGLKISGCEQLVSSALSAPDIHELDLGDCGKLQIDHPTTLKRLTIRGQNVEAALLEEIGRNYSCSNNNIPMHSCYDFLLRLEISSGCDSLTTIQLDIFPILRRLDIRECPNLQRISQGQAHNHLQRLSMGECPQLESLPEGMHVLLPSLYQLHIEDCPKVQMFPEGGLPLNLKSMRLCGSYKLISSLKSALGANHSLFSLDIGGVDVECLPDEGVLPHSLVSLMIYNCGDLKRLDYKEQKQFRDPRVREWLVAVKDAMFDAEDLLDEIDYEINKWAVENDSESQTCTCKESSFFETSFSSFNMKIESRMKQVLADLEFLSSQKGDLGLKEASGLGVGSGSGSKVSQKLPSTSLVVESVFYGRDDDKDMILNWLTSDTDNHNKISIFAIVGMGGMGKTTLAQHVYNNPRIEEEAKFDIKVWVCVSDDFDVLMLSKTILNKITKSKDDSGDDLEMVHGRLKEKLSGNKYLLVLDDVWNEDRDQWKALQTPLKYGAKGSKILVTTRSNKVASIVQSNKVHELKQLQEDHSWQVFAQHAFQDDYPKLNEQLKEIGIKIVEKCQGLPLALETVGCLLHTKPSVSQWVGVLECRIWELTIKDSKIIPALLLSYYHLPSYLKRCFAYCALFPKHHEFYKESLIQLWVAENFVQFSQESTPQEEIGEQYFDDLLSMSFFQRSSGEKCFVMHDLLNDLAKYVYGDICFRLEVDKPESISKVRHFSFVPEYDQYFDLHGSLYHAKMLRTFMPMPAPASRIFTWGGRELVDELFSKFKFLRILSLYHCDLKEMPDSVGNLKHLRSLDLCYTDIKKLPDSTCFLCNLQVLKLNCCYRLEELPSNLHKLTNLRCLEFMYTEVRKMPMHMGKLKNLQVLSSFYVGKGIDNCSIQQLGELNLHGSLSIEELQNIVNPLDALAADLKNKTHLLDLELEWNEHQNLDDSIKERQVLENLQPSRHLEKLSIRNYSGTQFASWLSDNSSCNVVSLSLKNCKYCLCLPPLGLLPFLKELSIDGLDGIVSINADFFGSSSCSFTSLESLKFSNMKEWEEWECKGVTGSFPRLQRTLYNAERLRTFMSSSEEMSFHYYNRWHCKMSTDELFSKFKFLRVLSLSGYSNLTEAPDSVGNLKYLHSLDLSNTDIEKLPESTCSLYNLLILKLNGCKHLKELPSNLHKLTNLHSLELINTGVRKVPAHLGKLKYLQVLMSPFKVGKSREFSLQQLGELNLHGRLSIQNLQNVENPSDALAVDLKNKTHLVEVELRWDLFWNPDDSTKERDEIVIENLQPSKHLEKLTMRHYGGKQFPRWLFNNSLLNVVSLTLENCQSCQRLPPLGLLPFLKELSIEGLDGIVSINADFFGSSSCSFTSLESLEFYDMTEWEEWECKGVTDAFPRLQRLYIEDCPKLKGHLPEQLCHLNDLKISGCEQLVPSALSAPDIHKLYLRDCGKLQIDHGFTLKELTITGHTVEAALLEEIGRNYSCSNNNIPMHSCYDFLLRLEIISGCDSLTTIQLDIFPILRRLDIRKCPNLQRISQGQAHNHLKSLRIVECPQLESLPEGMHVLLPSLNYLYIGDCPKVQIFPEGGVPSNLKRMGLYGSSKHISLKSALGGNHSLESLEIGKVEVESLLDEGVLPHSLVTLMIRECGDLKRLDYKGLCHLSSLETLILYDCPRLQCLPEEGLPKSISTLHIDNCPLLQQRCREPEGEDWPKIAHIEVVEIR
ncbi:hypothetical protein JHK85_037443 [Glycine max]|nr:hypothetical protein JHK85_037443 [Glycine max]